MTTAILSTKVSKIENKIPDTSRLVTTTVLNTKISKVKNKIPDRAKYVTTQEFSKLNAKNFAARLNQDNVVNKTDFNNKLISLTEELPQIDQSI